MKKEQRRATCIRCNMDETWNDMCICYACYRSQNEKHYKPSKTLNYGRSDQIISYHYVFPKKKKKSKKNKQKKIA